MRKMIVLIVLTVSLNASLVIAQTESNNANNTANNAPSIIGTWTRKYTLLDNYYRAANYEGKLELTRDYNDNYRFELTERIQEGPAFVSKTGSFTFNSHSIEFTTVNDNVTLIYRNKIVKLTHNILILKGTLAENDYKVYTRNPEDTDIPADPNVEKLKKLIVGTWKFTAYTTARINVTIKESYIFKDDMSVSYVTEDDDGTKITALQYSIENDMLIIKDSSDKVAHIVSLNRDTLILNAYYNEIIKKMGNHYLNPRLEIFKRVP